ncbi:MAG: hypothetical protein D3922_00030 [Candidatus Electrothrix sp. AR1]|nr:hypothetical protein [Candidatus Electrothrix sp. AR1]
MYEPTVTSAEFSTGRAQKSTVSGNFTFHKVDEFFNDLDNKRDEWGRLTQLHTVKIVNTAESTPNGNQKTNDRIQLTLKDEKDTLRYLVIDFIAADIFRLRFNPSVHVGDYRETNTSFSVQDTYTDLRKAIKYYSDEFSDIFPHKNTYLNFDITLEETSETYSCTTKDLDSGKDILKVVFEKEKKTVTIYSIIPEENKVWVCHLGKIYYKTQLSYENPNVQGDIITEYSTVLSIEKPATAKYIGFGEKGGATICKNSQQLSYFNFDNMRYKSVHGIGALDSREPLYHSNPFFLEFYAHPEAMSGVVGSFVNNPSQILMDIGHTYSDQLRLATSYGDMDLLVFIGDSSKDILGKCTSLAGKARLKPRYALGYHQGGYGYENTQSMLDVVNGYGDSDVPFDGLHVDIDVQNHYRTFTMNEIKYRRICLGRDGHAGPIFQINKDDTVLLERTDQNGNHIEAVYPDGQPVKAVWIDGEMIEARYVGDKLKPYKNEDGTHKKAGLFLFEYLLEGHSTWTNKNNLKIKCSTNITPVVSNPYVMANNERAGTYRTCKSGLDGGYFVKYRKAIKDNPEDKATYNGSDYNGTYLGGVYYGQDAAKKELGSFGHYPDFGNKDTRLWWGQQYKDLMKAGLSMIWQDMTTPAISINQHLQNEGESWFNFHLWNGERNIYKGAEYGNLCCSYKSFPFNLLLTDNFDKRYKQGTDANKVSPVGKIRNLYSYNLHKATYHGINNIWKINEMSFTWVILNDKALNKKQSAEILHFLLQPNNILKESSNYSISCYIVKTEHIESNVESALAGSLYAGVADQVCQVLYDAKALQKRSNERNFIVGRGGFSGMHRFAALWSGDNASTWDFLKINIAQMLALGLSGQPMAGADIGGFENPEQGGGKWADPELVTRWTILGAFLPWFRNHYRRKGTKEFQELYKFQDYAGKAPENERFLYESVLPVSRRYIQLRYQLLQLLYDAMFENTITGMPIARPLFLQDEQDPQLFNDKLEFLNSQFFIGKDLMIAGIMDKQREVSPGNFEAKREIYFPVSSAWYQFLQNKKALAAPVKGGTTIEYDAVINKRCTNPDSEQLLYVLPMYVREGGILPMTDSERYVGAYYNDHKESMPVTINIYPSQVKMTAYTMYLDDGKSRSSAFEIDPDFGGDPKAKGEFRRVDIKHTPDADWNRTVIIDRKHNGINLDVYKLCPYYYIALPHDPSEPINTHKNITKDAICNVKVNGQIIPFFAATDVGEDINSHFNNSPKNIWYFNTALNTSYIKVYEKKSLKITFTNI